MHTRSYTRLQQIKMKLQFDTLIKKKMPLKQVFERATTYGLFDLNADTYTHQACKVIAGGDPNILMLHLHWDFKTMIPMLDNEQALKDIFDTLECGFYTKDLVYMPTFSHIALTEAMEEGKLIYIVLSIENYELDEMEEGNEYGHHCTSLIFYPREMNQYDCFYINAHGEDMTLTTKFDDYITRRRYTRYAFDETIDVVCIKKYITFLRQAFVDLESRVQINYDGTKYHNYYGPNLQSGDDHGVCFAFPLIIWYYISNFYNTERLLWDAEMQSSITLPSFQLLLEKKDLIALVDSCFLIFHKKYEDAVWNKEACPISRSSRRGLRGQSIYCMDAEENTYARVHASTKLTFEEIMWNRNIESIIKKSGTIFIKRIALGIVLMLTDSNIKKIIYY